MRKRKDRIEQWRAERRLKLGIDKVIQQPTPQTSKVKRNIINDEQRTLTNTFYILFLG